MRVLLKFMLIPAVTVVMPQGALASAYASTSAPICEALLSSHLGSGVEVELPLTNNLLTRLTHSSPKWQTLQSVDERREFLRQEVIKNIKQRKLYSSEIEGLKVTNSQFQEIHNRSAEDAKKMSGLEIHRSTSELAGENIRSSVQALRSENLSHDHASLHAHLIFSYTKLENKYGPNTPLLLTEYFKRVNLFAEIISRIDGFLISEISTNIHNGQKQNLFGYLTQDKISEVLKYLSNDTNNVTEEADQKMCFVGFRPKGRYRSQDLMGFEYRALLLKISSFSLITKVLDKIHARLLQAELFDQPEVILSWNSKLKAANSDITNAWYNNGSFNRKLLTKSPKAIQDLIKSDTHDTILSVLFTLAEKDAAVLMLLYDWQQDSLFYNQPLASQKVLEAQLNALKNLAANPDHSQQILTQFFVNSGLLRIAGSF